MCSVNESACRHRVFVYDWMVHQYRNGDIGEEGSRAGVENKLTDDVGEEGALPVNLSVLHISYNASGTR
jgi:hypothetical protein